MTALEDVPETVERRASAPCTVGAYQLDGDLLLVLDPDRMLAVAS